MLIDTHAHINFNAYCKDANQVIERSLAEDTWVINVGSQLSTSERAVRMAEKYPKGVYAAIGLHPIHLAGGIFKLKIDPAEVPNGINGAGREKIQFKTREEKFDFQKYKKLASSDKVVAIGEIGLDYYYRPKTKIKLEQFKEKQKQTFLDQLGLAKELNLPVIFHCRMAHDELIELFEEQVSSHKFQGVIHCFTGSWQQAKKYLSMGFYLGFNGIIFKLNLDKIIEKTPLERILVETDCPYLSPPPTTGRNEPLYLKYIAEKVARLKKTTFQEIVKVTTKNAKELFNLK